LDFRPEIISPEEFKRLEERFPIGGIEKEGIPNVATTERTIKALKKLNNLRKQFDINDSSEKFYEQVGKNSLPTDAFDKVIVDNPNELSNLRKKALSLGGALVGKTEDGKQIWLTDAIGTQAFHSQLMRNNNQDIDVRNASTPNINWDTEEWNLLNTDIPYRDALGNGYIIPIKGSDAIFVPSFASPDFTMGMEWETNIFTGIRDILNHVENRFGYKLNNLGFVGDWNTTSEPSIPGGGTEYVSPTMSGIRGFKATYMFAEALKDFGAQEIQHHSYSRNDPVGIHVNVGSIPPGLRKDSIRFMADYLRLTEDFYKKATSPDNRYRYRAISGWPYDNGVMPSGDTFANIGRLTPEAARNVAEYGGRQFWAQDVSNVRMARNGLTEYEWLRKHGEHYGQINAFHASSNENRLAKYRTVAVHKLTAHGIIENRTAIFRPGGDFSLAHLAFTTKLASDIYQGGLQRGNFAKTDKLIPPTEGWDNSTSFKKLLKEVMGINNPVGQKFWWEMYSTHCRG